MTPKQYLQQAYLLDEKINSRLRELKRLRELSECVSALSYTSDKVQASRKKGSQVESNVIRIIELERTINDEIEQLLKLKEEIRTAINNVEDEREKLILRMRYLEYLSWETIADRLAYTKQRVHQLHGIALQRINPPI